VFRSRRRHSGAGAAIPDEKARQGGQLEYFHSGRNFIEVGWFSSQDPDGNPRLPPPPFPLWRPRSTRGFFFGLSAMGSPGGYAQKPAAQDKEGTAKALME
jgi:hypothetical protein